MKAIILAAGQGSRMGELTKSLPKPLMKFGEKTIISRLVNQLISRKITNIDIVVGYLYKEIINEINSNFLGAIDINFIINKDYKNDTNIHSAFLGINTIHSGDFSIFESDCIYSEEAMDIIVNSFNDEVSHWYTIGSFHKNQNGGILLADSDGKILDIKIVDKYYENFRNYNKLIGLLYVSSAQRNLFAKLLSESLKISSKQYYLQPWIDNLAQLKCTEIPLPDNSSAAFNNNLEYNDALQIK